MENNQYQNERTSSFAREFYAAAGIDPDFPDVDVAPEQPVI